MKNTSKETKKYSSRDKNGMFHIYSVWKSMLRRCKNNKNYLGCTVCDEWLEYQNFAEWYINNDFYGLGHDLDKDILIKGNKLYSPETCSLLPKEVNMAINGIYLSKGRFKQGVSLTKSGKFQAQLSCFGENKYLGCFETEKEAEKVYKQSKEEYIKIVADKWRDTISKKSYDALMLWSV